MQQTGPVRGPASVEQLAKLASALRDRDSRSSFMADPRGSAKRSGADPDAVPTSVMDCLAGMSEGELDAIMRFHDALAGAGMVVEGPRGRDGGTVSFF